MKTVKAVLVFVILAAALAACRGADGSDAKIAVVESYISAANEKNWDEAAKFLAEDIIFETPTGSCQGVAVCLGGPGPDREEPSNFTVDGNTVRWEMIVTFPDFQTPAKGEAVVEDGKILSYKVIAP